MKTLHKAEAVQTCYTIFLPIGAVIKKNRRLHGPSKAGSWGLAFQSTT